MIYAISLGFVPARIARESFHSFYTKKHPGLEVRHIFLNQHYPLNEAENSVALRVICDSYGIEFMDAGRNLGLHKGWNYVQERLPLKPEDVVIAYDPDSNPISPGWDMALITALNDPRHGWATLNSAWAEDQVTRAGFEERIVGGHLAVRKVSQACMNSVSAWKGKYLLHTKGLYEGNEFYGGLECHMFPKLAECGLEWVFVRDWWEDHSFHVQQDPQYRDYKWAHAHLGTWKGDFKSFLDAGCPMPAPTPPKF